MGFRIARASRVHQLSVCAPNAAKLGWRLGAMWRLGLQWNSPNLPTFYEGLDQVASLGLHHIEGSTRPELSKQCPEIHITNAISDETCTKVLAWMAEKDVKLTSYYTNLSRDKQKCRHQFELAKRLGIETFVGEPPQDAFDMIEKLCEEYQVNFAIHNHAPPTKYWKPESILAVCKGRSKRIGACADTGHWTRSGLDPVETVKKLGNRIISFHLRDMNRFGTKDAHDVAWGTGKGNIQGILKEVHRQGLKPLFVIEHEHETPNALAEIVQSIQYFDKVAAQLAVSK